MKLEKIKACMHLVCNSHLAWNWIFILKSSWIIILVLFRINNHILMVRPDFDKYGICYNKALCEIKLILEIIILLAMPTFTQTLIWNVCGKWKKITLSQSSLNFSEYLVRIRCYCHCFQRKFPIILQWPFTIKASETS